MAWLGSPTGIIRSGYEGMFSALEIEAPLRQGKCTPNLYLAPMDLHQLEHHLETGLKAAVAGSHVLLNHLSEQNESLVIRAKRDGSLVSAVDLESHHAIAQVLRDSRIPIISEEGELPTYAERSTWPIYWLVDPLDGTEAYLNHREGFAVNIALCDGSGPVLGIISDPLTDRIFAGSMGGAPFIAQLGDLATRNFIEQRPLQAPYQLVTSWNEALSSEELLPKRFDPSEFQSKPVNGALKFCHIATGEADVHVRSASYMEWDCAAGDGLLRSMGLPLRDRITDHLLTYNTMALRAGNLYAARF
jgi:3'(2'), 5'-bisphosphate nucleotidase